MHDNDCELRRRRAFPCWPEGETCWCVVRAMYRDRRRLRKHLVEQVYPRLLREQPDEWVVI